MKRLAVLAACLAALVFGLLALAEGETVIKGGSGYCPRLPPLSRLPRGRRFPSISWARRRMNRKRRRNSRFRCMLLAHAATSVALDFSAFADGDVLIQYSSQGDPKRVGLESRRFERRWKGSVPSRRNPLHHHHGRQRNGWQAALARARSNPKAKQMRRERSRLSWREKRP